VPTVPSRNVKVTVAVVIDASDLVWSSPDGLELVGKSLFEGSALVHYLISHLESDVQISKRLGVSSLLVSSEGKDIVSDLAAKVKVFEVVFDGLRSISAGGRLVLKGGDLALAYLDRCSVRPFHGGIVDGIFCAPKVVHPVILPGVDINPKDLGDGFVGSFSAAVCILVECSGWEKIDIIGFMGCFVEVGNKLRSSIRNDLLGNAIPAVDMSDQSVADVPCRILIFKWCEPD